MDSFVEQAVKSDTNHQRQPLLGTPVKKDNANVHKDVQERERRRPLMAQGNVVRSNVGDTDRVTVGTLEKIREY